MHDGKPIDSEVVLTHTLLEVGPVTIMIVCHGGDL
jgi:hypothetical protein